MRLILVRHAHTRTAGRILTGRTPGVRLTGEGRSQARRLADALATLQVEAVVSSPLERALETADAIAKARSLRVEAREAWTELDFGEWTNRVISEPDDDPRWREWNSARETARIPGGESMGEARDRVVADAMLLAGRHPGGIVVAVTHAEIVRAMILHAREASLDSWHALDIPPASVSVLELRGGRWLVTSVCQPRHRIRARFTPPEASPEPRFSHDPLWR